MTKHFFSDIFVLSKPCYNLKEHRLD